MRLHSVTGLALAALLLSSIGGPPSFAQSGGYIYYPPDGRQPGYVRPRQAPEPAPYGRPAVPAQPRAVAPGYPGYYPGKLVQPAPQPQPGFSIRRLFGLEEEETQRPAARQPSPRQAAPARPSRPRPTVAKPEKPKVDPSIHVVVFGDSLADLTGQGLDEAFSDSSDIAIIRKARAEAGLVRVDQTDWPKVIQDHLNDDRKAAVAVMMIGANDRQGIREGEVVHEPLSERWREIYRERVDAVVRAFKERGLPLVWVGAPPMKNERLSADLMSINEIVRDRVQRAGGIYVDIWPAFVDEQNRYTATGPDADGQPARLRAGDGVHFTKAGARKAAHFVEVEIKRVLEAKRAGTPIATLPNSSEGSHQGNVDQIINASVPALPEPAGTPPLAPKPLAGPVVPLTRPDLAPGGALISGRPNLDPDSHYSLQRALRDGVPPSPRPGRADDFRWPRS